MEKPTNKASGYVLKLCGVEVNSTLLPKRCMPMMAYTVISKNIKKTIQPKEARLSLMTRRMGSSRVK